MSPGIRLAADACLFVLDDEGVFFSGARQALSVFNTPATYLWCCLEESRDPREIARGYARAFGVDPAEAGRRVADTLNAWQGLGYLSGVEVPPATPIDWTTALGRLLTTPALRAEFAGSPRRAAAALGVRAGDVDALAALSPDDLEAQAQRIVCHRAVARHGEAPASSAALLGSVFRRGAHPLDVALEARARGAAPSAVHRYRLLGTTVRLAYPSPETEARVHPVLAHLEVAAGPDAEVPLELLAGAGGFLLLQDLVPLDHCARIEQVAPVVKDAVRRIAVDRHPHLFQLHAGVVSDGRRCLLLPGAAGSGKTTLTAALVRSGFRYFSDEFAPLERRSLAVRPVPLALTVKAGAMATLDPWYPGLAAYRAHVRQDDEVVRYLRPPPGASAPDTALPVGRIVFPRYEAGARTELCPLGRVEALGRLMRECLTLPVPLDREDVADLVRWMREVPCFELPVGALDEAVGLVSALCGAGGEPPRC